MDGGAASKVEFMIPAAGGTVGVMTPNGMKVDFAFPKVAAGMMVTLTPISATDIGWPVGQFAQVIKMEPDGAQFADPIVVRPSTGDVIVLDFPSSSSKSQPEALPLNGAADGFLLSHFSTLVVVPPETSCDSTSGFQVSSEAPSRCTDANYPTSIAFVCKAYSYCLLIDAHCCAPAGATACHLGDSLLTVSFTPTDSNGGQYPYCSAQATDAGVAQDAAAMDASLLCQPGATASCNCGAGNGTKTCNQTGTSYDACICVDAGSHDAAVDAALDAGGYICTPNSAAACDCVGSSVVGSHKCNQAGTGYDACVCPDGGAIDAGTPLAETCDQAGTWISAGPVPNAEALYGVWGYGSVDNNVFVVGMATATRDALIGHYDGASWTSQTLTTTDTGQSLFAIWGVDPTHVFAVGSGGLIYSYNGSSWSLLPSPTTQDLHGIWGSDATHYWVVGAAGTAWYFDGTNWNDHSIVGSATNNVGTLHGVWGRAADNIWVVNDSGGASNDTYSVHHYSAGTWTAEPSTAWSYYTKAIWGASSNDIWAVGYSKGTSAHWDGNTWTGSTAPAASPYLQGVWGRNGTHVWAVGDGGKIDFWDGHTWTACTAATQLSLNAVVGTYTKVWAVGTAGTVLRMD